MWSLDVIKVDYLLAFFIPVNVAYSHKYKGQNHANAPDSHKPNFWVVNKSTFAIRIGEQYCNDEHTDIEKNEANIPHPQSIYVFLGGPIHTREELGGEEEHDRQEVQIEGSSLGIKPVACID